MSFPSGKVVPEILKEIVLKYLGTKNSDVLLGPSYGEDAAIVKLGDHVLAISCDPISGAEERIGWLSVNVSANDVATRGIKPRWFLPCIMLPEGSENALLREICVQMDDAAKNLEVAIIGGHTEVTPGISHPLVIGFCAGFTKEDRFVTCAGVKPGSKIILTKGAGIEGTAILAADRRETLVKKFGKELVAKAESYFNMISIVREAMLAIKQGGVLAMHDPTEGGIAGGLNEMAEASGTGFEVYENQIYISQETKKICRFFKIDPLKLISSGALIIAIKPEKAEDVVSKIRKIGIKASIIGEFSENKKMRKIVRKDGIVQPLHLPKSDELWKALKKKL